MNVWGDSKTLKCASCPHSSKLSLKPSSLNPMYTILPLPRPHPPELTHPQTNLLGDRLPSHDSLDRCMMESYFPMGCWVTYATQSDIEVPNEPFHGQLHETFLSSGEGLQRISKTFHSFRATRCTKLFHRENMTLGVKEHRDKHSSVCYSHDALIFALELKEDHDIGDDDVHHLPCSKRCPISVHQAQTEIQFKYSMQLLTVLRVSFPTRTNPAAVTRIFLVR